MDPPPWHCDRAGDGLHLVIELVFDIGDGTNVRPDTDRLNPLPPSVDNFCAARAPPATMVSTARVAGGGDPGRTPQRLGSGPGDTTGTHRPSGHPPGAAEAQEDP